MMQQHEAHKMRQGAQLYVDDDGMQGYYVLDSAPHATNTNNTADGRFLPSMASGGELA